MFGWILKVQFNTITFFFLKSRADGASLLRSLLLPDAVIVLCSESPLGRPLTCREWMGMEQRPQLFRWQTASTVAALPNSISLLSSSCWDTENRTWKTPLSGQTGRNGDKEKEAGGDQQTEGQK